MSVRLHFCRSLCYCLVDLISYSHGRYPREDGAPGHALPGAGQHLQQRHHQHPQGRGAHSNRSLDVGLYPLCFRSLSRVSLETKVFLKSNSVYFRYATLLFKKQRYVSGQHKVNLKIICKENYKYEVQEKSPANQAVTVQQLAEEYWRFVL